VASQLTMAQFWDSNTRKSFGQGGDCPTCTGSAPQIPMSMSQGQTLQNVMDGIQNNLGKNPTSFTLGNGYLSNSTNSAPIYSSFAQAPSSSQPVVQPPLVAPQFKLPTQSYIDSLFPSNWMNCSFPPVMAQPYTPRFWPGLWI